MKTINLQEYKQACSEYNILNNKSWVLSFEILDTDSRALRLEALNICAQKAIAHYVDYLKDTIKKYEYENDIIVHKGF